MLTGLATPPAIPRGGSFPAPKMSYLPSNVVDARAILGMDVRFYVGILLWPLMKPSSVSRDGARVSLRAGAALDYDPHSNCRVRPPRLVLVRGLVAPILFMTNGGRISTKKVLQWAKNV